MVLMKRFFSGVEPKMRKKYLKYFEKRLDNVCHLGYNYYRKKKKEEEENENPSLAQERRGRENC